MSDIDLLPRADIPVLFNDFKTKADAVWAVVDSLVVTDVSQKEAMALARKTRLDLRNIRIAVEHKRVELGENHLKEIQKVNGAAKAIREFIEPLEARLLVQETYAERAEEKCITELAIVRFGEVAAINPGVIIKNLGQMPQDEYSALIARLRDEKAEVEALNRRLAEAQAEVRRVEQAVRAEAAKLMLEQQAEQKRLDDEAERIRFEQEAKHRAELQAANAIRTIEREAAEKRRQEDLRIEREKTAKLEAELEKERAEKREKFLAECAERNRLRALALAPDVEKLRAFIGILRDGVHGPSCSSPEAKLVVEKAREEILAIALDIEHFCGV